MLHIAPRPVHPLPPLPCSTQKSYPNVGLHSPPLLAGPRGAMCGIIQWREISRKEATSQLIHKKTGGESLVFLCIMSKGYRVLEVVLRAASLLIGDCMPRCALCNEDKRPGDPFYTELARWDLIDGKATFFCCPDHKKKFITRRNELKAQARARLKDSKPPT